MLPQWLCGRERETPSRAPAEITQGHSGPISGVKGLSGLMTQRRRYWATIVPPTSGVGRILTALIRFWTPIRHSRLLKALPSPTRAKAFNNINH